MMMMMVVMMMMMTVVMMTMMMLAVVLYRAWQVLLRNSAGRLSDTMPVVSQVVS